MNMVRILVFLAAALPLFANVPLPPAPVNHVTDAAGVIPDDRQAALSETLAAFDRETSNQLLVYVDRKVPAGTTLEEMGAEAIRTWRVGQVEKDNGAILFIFIDDRQSRIEVGYGLEGVLTDAVSKRILVALRPSLQNGDYAAAAELGAQRIIGVVGGGQSAVGGGVVDQQGAIAARQAEIDARDEKMFIPILLFSVVFLSFFFYMLYRVFIVGDWKLGGSGSSRSGSSSSSSSSSSGFSGGGGSGGGGGASDRW